MKKIFSICLLVMMYFITANTQSVTADRSLSYDNTWFIHVGLSTDTIGEVDSTWTYDITKRTDSKISAGFYIDVDSTGGTGAALSIYVQKKGTDGSTFVNTDTATISSGVDSSFYFETSTSHISQYWRIFLQSADNAYKAKINRLEGVFIKD